MDKFIYNAFQNLPDTAVPASLHTSIVRAAMFRLAFKYLYIATFITTVTFIVSLWHLHTRMLATEAFAALKIVMETFELNMASIADSARTLFDVLPVHSITLSLLNFIALVFMIVLLRSFMRLEEKFVG